MRGFMNKNVKRLEKGLDGKVCFETQLQVLYIQIVPRIQFSIRTELQCSL